jgi:parallel beta-helix repeat protein
VGILVADGAFAITMTGNTASQNGFAGINLEGTVSNTVTDNTTTQNGDRGINVRNSSGNTVTRNTSDRNGASGIDISGDSHGNSLARNSCTANGDGGIRLIQEGAPVGPTQNTIQDNTVSGSFRGIWLAFGPISQNTLQGNSATLNVLGIWLESGAMSNGIQGNTALNNGQWDMGDQNANCDTNAWSGNKFVTDNVAGVPDSGPSGGCIR